MPSPRHASSSTRTTARDNTTRRGRTGWPLPVDDAPPSLLSPLMSNLPSISGISEMAGVGALKSFLPMGSPSPLAEVPPVNDDTTAVWRDADLGGGKSRILLLTSAAHALQVFAFTDGVIPDDPHIQESFPAPIELASVPRIEYERDAWRAAVAGVEVARDATLKEHVLAVDLVDARMSAQQGPTVALTCRSADGRLAAVLVSLRTGKAFSRLDLGKGQAASVICSPRAIVITASHPSPCIHVVNGNLETTHAAITDLPADATTLLPVVALSGRLLAYATDEPAATPGPHGLGSIATARTTRPRVASAAADTSAPHAGAQTAQGAFRSAVEIGGGVARGVWAGIKMGAKAAQAAQAQANAGRLAQSAPNDRVLEDHLGLPGTNGAVESRSVEDGMPAPDQLAKPPAGVWVKIVDLGSKGRVVAHFRLPPQRHLVPTMPSQSPRGSAVARDHPVSLLSFSPDGTRLFVAPSDGRAFNVLELRPQGATPGKPGASHGEVWEAYVLRRGNTTARVRTVAWARDQRYIAVGTGRGTIHVFAISPGGGQPSAASHVPVKLRNAHLLPPLSVNITPCARIRPYRDASDTATDKAEAEVRSSYAVPTFTALRPHPLAKDILCQDMAIYRPHNGELDLARLGVRKTAPAAELSPPTGRRGSNLTEMMRQRTGLRNDSDLEVEAIVKARWALPLGRGDADDVETITSPKAAPTRATAGLKNLHHAEIRTHTTNPRVLPASIYLSHQVEFYAAVPTDEYSPLSVLDKVARTRRLVFRPEVEVLPSTEARSFDEPLSSALHSMMDSRPSTQVPRLPNGSPSKGGLWGTIPIRQVAANLGEGVDRVRREYARAQHRRSRRRSNAGAGGTPLSFEDDTVFATLDDGEGDIASASSAPSSGPLPPTVDGGDAELDEWNDRWEDEYRRAVEDDGGAEDLVLGLMDEEEEERRRWEARQKQLKKQYQ